MTEPPLLIPKTRSIVIRFMPTVSLILKRDGRMKPRKSGFATTHWVTESQSLMVAFIPLLHRRGHWCKESSQIVPQRHTVHLIPLVFLVAHASKFWRVCGAIQRVVHLSSPKNVLFQIFKHQKSANIIECFKAIQLACITSNKKVTLPEIWWKTRQSQQKKEYNLSSPKIVQYHF